MSTTKLKKRNNSLNQIKKMFEEENKILIIHYSCESFYNPSKITSSRITSIAVQHLKSKNIHSFSIHKTAEIKKIQDISENYNLLEKEMLAEFFSFLENHKDYFWVHWNMRDINYGFQAIVHRFKVLGGRIKNTYDLDDSKKFDLASNLISIYCPRYTKHPRLQSICKLNNIGQKDFLSGEDEAKSFDEGRYIDLHRSTLRKVDILSILLEKTATKTLKTNSNLKDQYGISSKAFLAIISEELSYFLLWNIFILIIGGILSTCIAKIIG